MMIEIIKIVIWPATIIIAIILLRKGLVDLIPTLKKLKYKDLEVEFEKDAINLLATIERDVPYTEPPEEEPIMEYVRENSKQYSVKKLTPSEFVLHEWMKIENEIKFLSERNNIKVQSSDSIRAITDRLLLNGIIDSCISNALLELSTYRNKVAHAQNEYINEEMSNAFFESANRVLLYLRTIWNHIPSTAPDRCSATLHTAKWVARYIWREPEVNKKKNIEQELDHLVSIYENGGGFGDPDAKAEHEGKIQLLMHKQIQSVSKRNNQITIANIVIAALNVGVLIYQVLFK